jgi:pilus assembly protein CpaB
MRTRLIIIGLALALGGAAAALSARYLTAARTDIAAESKPIEVLVALEDVPRGLPAEELVNKKMVELQKVPQRFVAAGAISTAKAIEGQVLCSPLTQGEQLTTARFQLPSTAGLAYSVPGDFLAVAIPVDEVRGISQLVKPGDRVAVYGTFSPGPNGEKDYTRLLLPEARVLAMGGNLSDRETPEDGKKSSSGGIVASRGAQAGESPSNMTLAVSPVDAEKLIFAEETAKVWVALLPASAEQPITPSGQTIKTVLR